MSESTGVVIKQLPEQFTIGKIQAFLREIAPFFQANRPRFVFDFSQVKQMDSAAVDMLLYCMEEAMKRNGDLKFAAVPPPSAIILELTRVDQLFEVFDTVSDAVDSFSGLAGINLDGQYDWYAGSMALPSGERNCGRENPNRATVDGPDNTARW